MQTKTSTSLLASVPIVLLSGLLIARVAHSQPPVSNPSAQPSYDIGPTPTPTPQKSSVSQRAVVAPQAITPYTGTVTISTPVRDPSITESSVPYGTADTLHRRVNVTFSQPLPTDATVEFLVLNSGANAGSAHVVQDANRRTNGTISLEGTAQTEPGYAGTLKVDCIVNDAIVGESGGFSVCAHPNGLNYKFLGNIQGAVQPLTNQPFWGSLYGCQFAELGSDSGNPSDLNDVSINEVIKVTTSTGFFAGNPPAVGINFAPATGGIADLVGVAGNSAADVQQGINAAVAAGTPSSQLVGEQYHVFSCDRCNIPADANSPKVPNSGFRNYATLSKSTTGGVSKYYVRDRKSPFDGNGVARGTVDNNTTQTIEIK